MPRFSAPLSDADVQTLRELQTLEGLIADLHAAIDAHEARLPPSRNDRLCAPQLMSIHIDDVGPQPYWQRDDEDMQIGPINFASGEVACTFFQSIEKLESHCHEAGCACSHTALLRCLSALAPRMVPTQDRAG